MGRLARVVRSDFPHPLGRGFDPSAPQGFFGDNSGMFGTKNHPTTDERWTGHPDATNWLVPTVARRTAATSGALLNGSPCVD